MRKIIFVGMHNKPGLKPLDSTTVTGKVVDRIIIKLFAPSTKTNLCDLDEWPKDKSVLLAQAQNWWTIHQPNPGDIIVLFGHQVRDSFLRLKKVPVIELNHPASLFGTRKKFEYVEHAVEKIKTCYTPGMLEEQYKWEVANGWQK